ncbi:MAG: peptidase M61, partial [Achromobacter sp.]|nr:peptidase M61 [Achromobacter sp.]
MEKDQAPPLLYRLAPHDPAGHRYRITLTIPAPSPGGQRLSLPAWIPGSYLIRDFSRQIESLAAYSGTRRVAVDKTDN